MTCLFFKGGVEINIRGWKIYAFHKSGSFGGTIAGVGGGVGLGVGVPAGLSLGSALLGVLFPLGTIGLSYIACREIYRAVVAGKSSSRRPAFRRQSSTR